MRAIHSEYSCCASWRSRLRNTVTTMGVLRNCRSGIGLRRENRKGLRFTGITVFFQRLGFEQLQSAALPGKPNALLALRRTLTMAVQQIAIAGPGIKRHFIR